MVTEDASTSDLRRAAVLVIRWAVPLAIIGVFVLSGHLGEALAAIADVSLGWAIPLVLVGIALPLSHAWRWCFLLRRADTGIPLSGSVSVTALASLVNYAAPGFLGAPAKAVFSRDSYNVPVSRSLPTLAAEQALDALALALAGLLSALIAGPVVLDSFTETSMNQVAVAALALLIAGAVIFTGWQAGRRLTPGFFEAMRTATGSLIRSREHRGPIVALTVARWLLDMAAVGLASLAVGLRLGLLEILLIANLSLLIGVLAPVPGGLGVREAAMASIAGVLTVSIPAVLALSVLHRAGLAVGLPLVLGAARLYEWRSR